MKVGHIAECDAGFGVEAKSDAGELVRVIDRLQAKSCVGLGQGAHRDQRVFRRPASHRAGARSSGPSARLVFDLEDDLVLVVGFLDQVDVVLRIGGAKQTLELGGRDAVEAGAVAIDIDVEVRAYCERDRNAAARQSRRSCAACCRAHRPRRKLPRD